MDYENIGKERLQDLIEEKKSSGVPQKQMALDLGMSESQITKYKNGEIDTLNIQADTLIKLAEYFNVSTDYLLGLQETPTNNKYMDAASEYIGLDLKTTEKIKKLNVEDKKMLELLVRETDFLTFLPKVAAFIETLERTTDIPLVPPSKRECGKMNNTVLSAYIMLPRNINRNSFNKCFEFTMLHRLSAISIS